MATKKNNQEKKIIITHASVKEAVQKRITPFDHSSIIPGIDVNELKHSLDLLKYALDYSEAIVDTVQVPLIILDRELRVLTANRSFYDTFRLAPTNTENQLIYKLNEGAWNSKRLRNLLEKILPKNTHFDKYELDINHPHLGLKTMLLSARKTYRQVNNTEAILLAFEDITERKQLDTQKDDFIGIVSHELKNPLTAIQGFTELLEKHLVQIKDEKGTGYLIRIRSQMERLNQLMASFINVYKIQNGKIVLNKVILNLDELIRKVVSDFRESSKKHKITVNTLENLKIFADENRIRQVLVNVISNAIKYSPKADRVIVNAILDDKHIVISIKDFGIGIPKEEHKKIFSRFFRVKYKKTHNISGLGLGLFISWEIIKLHKGKIWVDSAEGKGSTFFISLPVK